MKLKVSSETWDVVKLDDANASVWQLVCYCMANLRALSISHVGRRKLLLGQAEGCLNPRFIWQMLYDKHDSYGRDLGHIGCFISI